MRLTLLYCDDDLVAVDKPPGLLVHRSRIADADAFALQALRDQLGRRVHTVHRLDRPTSGVLVLGLTAEAARRLSAQFQAQRVVKRYLAVVRGWPPAEGAIDRSLDDPEASAAGQRAPRAALTRYRRLATVELPVAVTRYPTSRYALMQVQPCSGRRHQIRRHFLHIRHPIIGDTSHGEGRHNRFFRERYGLHRLLLHAWQLSFTHPMSGLPLDLEAPLDTQWDRLLAELDWTGALATP
ncbi:MAG: pseudouridylate synthase [Gammaproteobacteria bacterium]|jgi:tRNA pseudouridine65 synthase|nr:pseudouridylate synthase [Gammaproteobacteria bacterium]